MARECYLVSIFPLVDRAKEHGPKGPSQTRKRARARPPSAVPEALVIHTLTSDDMEQVPLEEEHPERTVQLGRDIIAVDKLSLVSLL